MESDKWWVVIIKVILYPIGAFFVGSVFLVFSEAIYEAATSGSIMKWYLVSAGTGGTLWWLWDQLGKKEEESDG